MELVQSENRDGDRWDEGVEGGRVGFRIFSNLYDRWFLCKDWLEIFWILIGMFAIISIRSFPMILEIYFPREKLKSTSKSILSINL